MELVLGVYKLPTISLRFPSVKPRTLSVTRASSSSSSRLESPSLLKPISLAVITIAVTAYLHRRPVLASTPAPTTNIQSELQCESETESSLNSILASNPDDIAALRSLMELKVKSRDLAGAISIVDRLIEIDPGERDLPLLKSHLQSYSGDIESARKGFESLIEADPLVVEAYHGLVLIASRSDTSSDDLQAMIDRVQQAIGICESKNRREELLDFKLLLAQIKVIQGKHDEALRMYQELVTDEPSDFRPYLCQGIIYTLLRKKEEAEKQFDKYQRLVPKGHPYARYFEENMAAMSTFSQAAASKRETAATKN